MGRRVALKDCIELSPSMRIHDVTMDDGLAIEDVSIGALGQFKFHWLLWEVGRHHFVRDRTVVVFDVVLPEQFRDENLQFGLGKATAQACPASVSEGQADEGMDLLAGVWTLADVCKRE